jgi:hypothetical protein
MRRTHPSEAEDAIPMRFVRPSHQKMRKIFLQKKAWERQEKRKRKLWGGVEKGGKIIGPEPCTIYVLDASSKLFQAERTRSSDVGGAETLVGTEGIESPVFELYRSSPGSAKYTLNRPVFLLGRACEVFVSNKAIGHCIDGYVRNDLTSVKMFERRSSPGSPGVELGPELLSGPEWQYGGTRKPSKSIEQVALMVLKVRFLTVKGKMVVEVEDATPT